MSYTPMFKEMRKQAGLTQEELAEKAGIKLSTYRTWEQGVAKKVPLEAVCNIAAVLHCTPNDLCGWYIYHPEDKPAKTSSDITADEARVLSDYRSSTPQGRRDIEKYARERCDLAALSRQDGASCEEGAA